MQSPHVYHWPTTNPKAIIHIIHGMTEHGARYEHFARALNNQGFGVYCPDVRGHGITAGSLENVGFFAEKEGWKLVVNDAIEQTKNIKKSHPDIPVFILGHSMGSFIARSIAIASPKLVNGYILSATVGHPGWKGTVGKPLAKTLAFLFGKRKRIKFLTNTAFNGYNKRVENVRTERDWLTRDEAIVDAYVNDPYCMQEFTAQFFYDLSKGLLEINKQENINKVDKEEQVLMVYGEMDPAGEYGKGPKEVYGKYQKAGVNDLEIIGFEGGRHEILNETNREEVYTVITDWLNVRAKRKTYSEPVRKDKCGIDRESNPCGDASDY
ncbi:MAG: alpha/beta hydrolase [Crocinitomicaceae bacterium]|nr:alpha/beta hydrolase [Crocinitomicaceae bacterium]